MTLDSGVQETVPILFLFSFVPFVLPPAPADRCDSVTFGFACGRVINCFSHSAFGGCFFFLSSSVSRALPFVN